MNHYRVIIVDDERLIREGLRTYIDWQALNCEVVEVCEDGNAALRAIERHAPCIVLTDVSMPGMDGLELLRTIRRRQMDCEVIIISAYADFQYAQEALKCDAFDYVLKPLEPAPLYACVKRCVENAEKKKMESSALSLSQDTINEWFRNAILAMPVAEESLLNMLRDCATDVSQLCLLTAVDAQWEKGATGAELCVASLSAHVAAALYPSAAEAETARASMGDAQRSRITGAGEGISGGFCRSLCELWMQQLGDEVESELTGQEAALPPVSVVKALDEAAMLRHVRAVLAGLCERHCFHPLSMHNRVKEYFVALYHQMEACFQSPLPNVPTLEQCLDELAATNNLYDLLKTLERLMSNLYAAMALSPSYNSYTRKAIQIIHSRYSENLSLHAVAFELGISSAYFSTLFKENTGYPFSDYLYRYRMNIAQQMLKCGKYRIYEVASMVGYPDVVQFSKRFKQFFSISPRDMLRRG